MIKYNMPKEWRRYIFSSNYGEYVKIKDIEYNDVTCYVTLTNGHTDTFTTWYPLKESVVDAVENYGYFRIK